LWKRSKKGGYELLRGNERRGIDHWKTKKNNGIRKKGYVGAVYIGIESLLRRDGHFERKSDQRRG